jgi:hypothetical protein
MSSTACALASWAADSIFVEWEGEHECADGSVLIDGDKSCTAIFDLRGLSVNGSASRVGQVPAPGSAGSAQVKFSAKFASAGVVDLDAPWLSSAVLDRGHVAHDAAHHEVHRR